MNKNSPPKYPLRFFRWYCHSDFLEDIEGDLLERFEKRAKEKSTRSARWGFVKDVIRLFRPGIIRPITGIKKMNAIDILINHFSLTFRSLVKNKGFTAINLTGLTMAFLVCLFSFQYISFELSYDNYHKNGDSIYRMVTNVKTSTGIKLESSAIPAAPELAEQFPEILNYTRIFLDYLLVQSNVDNYQEENLAYAEASLFEVFTFPLVKGNPKTVFDAPFNAVLSESAALKYFGTLDCIGMELKLDGTTSSFVTGVMKDIPENSHFKVDIFLSLSSLTEVWNPGRATNWTAFGCYSYLLIDGNSDIAALNKKIGQFIDQKIQRGEASYTTELEPLTDLYLFADPRGSRTGSSVHGNVDNIYIFGIIALLVLFIAVFNFINISNALYIKRAKEISMKKILGVGQTQQKFQYLLDSISFSLFVCLIAISFFILFTPTINQLANKPIIGNAIDHYSLYILVFGLAILVGILSGIFPAFVLTNLKYDRLLKGNIKLGSKGLLLKNGLVVVQFAISIIMVISAVVVAKQLNYLQTKELGFSQSQKLIIDFHFDESIKRNEKTIKEKLKSLPGIMSASISSSVPGRSGRKSMTELPTKNRQVEELYTDAYYVDYDFINQYDIKLIAGRGFEEDRPSDHRQSMILNESAVKTLGYSDPEEVIGLPFLQAGRWKGEVIGVVKDFHFNSLHEKIAPLTMSIARGYFTYLILELNSNDVKNTVAQIEGMWKEILPELPLSYTFEDQTYEALYRSEQQLGNLTFYFAMIAISLSLIGLLGLATLTSKDRIKEMGIRKVLGASPLQLMILLSRKLMTLSLIGLIIGLPISIISSNKWLANFAYRLELSWWMITPVIMIILVLSLLTIGSQVYKASTVNPTESLKSE
ncbi:FtsX-like permease family protein [Fulvivirga sp.]|uniref:FtsX-like permease family protein n=1 Tax=Fulvivirga sp. TaxID=1931237 RepID=UPI0032EDD4FF